MKPAEFSELESQLTVQLEFEVNAAMAATSTPRELARFRTTTLRRVRRRRAIVAAAAVACVGAMAAGAVALDGEGSSQSTTPAHRTVLPTPEKTIVTSGIGAVSRLPSDVTVTKLAGPQNLGALAFGDLWATTGRDGIKVLPHATLYRIAADGSRVLSTTRYRKVNDNQPDPVRVGSTIFVADRTSGYTVVNPTGRKIGSFPSTSALGAVAGDASGGWFASKPNQITQVDATGLHVVQNLSLPLKDISSIAVSPGVVWVADMSLDQIVRVNPATGAVTGRVHLAFPPTQIRYVGGALYVATIDDYGIHRIDPATMRQTGSTTSPSAQYAQPTVLSSYDGQVWTQGLGGTISQLNPVTLTTERTVRLFPELSYVTNGGVIGPDRNYVVDGEASKLYSYPTR